MFKLVFLRTPYPHVEPLTLTLPRLVGKRAVGIRLKCLLVCIFLYCYARHDLSSNFAISKIFAYIIYCTFHVDTKALFININLFEIVFGDCFVYCICSATFLWDYVQFVIFNRQMTYFVQIPHFLGYIFVIYCIFGAITYRCLEVNRSDGVILLLEGTNHM